MCNAYVPASATDLARQFGVGIQRQYHPHEIYPRAPGRFIRRDRNAAGYACAQVLEQKASYKQPWARSQRCLIPVDHFEEPCWEAGRNIWWSFRGVDGDAFALAAIWNTWGDKATGESHESHAMRTMNADTHPIFQHKHKSDPKLPPAAQHKRMVVAEAEARDQWLESRPEQA